MKIRRYSELRRIDDFEERYEYLKIAGVVGRPTFGFDRYLNQRFYTSPEWKHVRQHVIARDYGLDLGVEGYEIFDRIIIHHMNPMAVDNIVHEDNTILDPEYLITTTHRTHNAIHYGDRSLLLPTLASRQRGDTKLW